MIKLVIRLGLAVLGSLLGAFLIFPGLRLAQTHQDALTLSADRPLLQLGGFPGVGWGGSCARGWWPGAWSHRDACPQAAPAHQLPVATVHLVALDEACCPGLPVPGTHEEYDLLCVRVLGR